MLPVNWDLPISNDCYEEVTDHGNTCITATLVISTTTPDGSTALPNIILEMTFFTISMVIGIGERLSGGDQIDVKDPTRIPN